MAEQLPPVLSTDPFGPESGRFYAPPAYFAAVFREGRMCGQVQDWATRKDILPISGLL